MTRLADNVRTSGNIHATFVPFTVFARIIPNPGEGRRWEKIRDREKLADRVEDCLKDIVSSYIAIDDYDIAFPTASTPQFGDKTARVTIHGNWKWPSGTPFTQAPAGEHAVLSSGRVLTGTGCGDASNIVADADVLTAVQTIKNDLENACMDGTYTFLNIYKMEVAGIIFGDKGRTFPR